MTEHHGLKQIRVRFGPTAHQSNIYNLNLNAQR
jgi:hypothetical protein